MTARRVVIVDDERMARDRMRRLVTSMPDLEVAAVCEDAETLLEVLSRETVDLVLLDIQLPGLTGIELLPRLPPPRPAVIYVTAHREHALAAFDVGAADYVLKPVAPERLRQAIDRVRPSPPAPLALPTARGVELVAPDTVTHASFDGHLVSIHRHGHEPVMSAMTLSELHDRLPHLKRVHRRHLLCLRYVARFESTPSGGFEAHLGHGPAIPVSRAMARQLRRQLLL